MNQSTASEKQKLSLLLIKNKARETISLMNTASLKARTCCFTGHRIIPQGEYKELSIRLERIVRELISQGIIYYGAGGALGFDTLAANCILTLRKEFPYIRLILVLPCLSQADRWSQADRIVYETIKAQADKVVYTSKDYTPECMHIRNRHLVDYSGTCVCYLTKKKGGTLYTVDYAKRNGLKIINTAI